MTTLFKDYIEAVVRDYQKKKAANTLAQRLIDPTPAKLKDECLAVCRERFLRRDDKTLRTFFGQAVDQNSYLGIINNFDIDKFRPLVKYLKNKTTGTEDKNIELLAWLIDFDGRPFDSKKIYEVIDTQPATIKEDSSVVQIVKSDRETPVMDTSLPSKPKTASKVLLAIIALVIFALAVISFFWKKQNGPQVFALTGHESCMFWAGDHFQQISCNQKMGDTMVVALDSVKLNHFKKITQFDTITTNSIGNVWYVKIRGNLEFYTADGFHPVHPEFRLRPITTYIINKYIRTGGKSE